MPKTRPVEDRFWEKVDRSGGDEACWMWMAYIRPNGYGWFAVTRDQTVFAHRMAWELQCGTIPDGMTIDHLCRVIACCNPAHLEVVTVGENISRSWDYTPRSATCRNGHARTAENTYVDPRGGRQCRLCRRESLDRSNARKRGADIPYVKHDSHWTRRLSAAV